MTWIPLFGGIEVHDAEELRFALSLLPEAGLPTPEEVAQAKAQTERERQLIFWRTGIAIDGEGHITGEAA
jgi:hypothetical protein